MNKIATIQTIHSFRTHNNADSLCIAKVLGFQVVVRKDEFKHGEKVVFVWPDTVAKPMPWNRFLDKKNDNKPIRIRSCKLRGEFSTGVVLPISVLDGANVPIEDGVEVAVPLGVEKYLKDIGKPASGESAGGYPSHIISKTDEDLAQSNPSVEAQFRGKACYLTQKIDGQSLTLISHEGQIRVCSRNLEIKEGDNKWWQTARKYGLPEKLNNLNIAIQGERIAPDCQGNPLGVSEQCLYVFNVKDLDTGLYYGYHDLVKFCQDMGVPMVPTVALLTYDENMSFDKLQEMADSHLYPNGKNAEGLVLRPITPEWCAELGRMLSVKFVSRNYKD